MTTWMRAVVVWLMLCGFACAQSRTGSTQQRKVDAGTLVAGDLYILCVGTEGSAPKPETSDLYAGDAKYVRQFLVAAEPNYRTTHSRVLTGAEATRQATLDGLRWLERAVRPEDTAIVFFSAHGGHDRKGRFEICQAGYFEEKRAARAEHAVLGSEVNESVARIKGRPIVWIDTCESGGLVDEAAGTVSRGSYLAACQAKEGSGGQFEQRDLPHGYFVLALCEALIGMADADKNRLVSLKEVETYLPRRIRQLDGRVHPVSLARLESAPIALTRVDPSRTPMQLYWPPTFTRRNPFNLPDVGNLDGSDIQSLLAQPNLPGDKQDPNAALWCGRRANGSAASIEGRWMGRWNGGSAKNWEVDEAEVKVNGNRVFIRFGSDYLIEARRTGADGAWLAGRYVWANDSEDTSPWVGRIVGNDRIDGRWDSGRFDFRRVAENPKAKPSTASSVPKAPAGTSGKR